MKNITNFMDTIYRGMDRLPVAFWFYLAIVANVLGFVSCISLVAEGNPFWVFFLLLGALNAYSTHLTIERFKAHKKAIAGIPVLHIPAFLFDTLYSSDWLTLTKQLAIHGLLPETWTHSDNLNVGALADGLRALGMPIASGDDFYAAMHGLEMLRLMLRRGNLIKRNSVESLIVITKIEVP